MKKNIGITRQASGPTHYRNAFPLALSWLGRRWSLRGIEFDVIAYEEIEASIAVVVEPRAPGTPAYLLIVDSSFAGYIGECAVAVVVKQDIVAPEAAEQIVPAIVVVVAHADACLPSCSGESRLFRNIGKCSIAIILVQVRRRCLCRRPRSIEACSIC